MPAHDVDPRLTALAAAHGVAVSYENWKREPVEVTREAVVAALGALGVDATTPDAVAAALTEHAEAPWRRLVPPSVVLRGDARVLELRAPAEARVRLTVQLEDGEEIDVAARGDVVSQRENLVLRHVELPALPLGWHRLIAEADRRRDEAVLVVAPDRIHLPAGLDRSWGWMLQLYALRSAASWGLGDYADLTRIVAHTSEAGGGLVLLNPVHAETPVLPLTPSPYSPSSRRFRSPLYLRIENTAEYRAASAEVRAKVDAQRPVTDPERINRDDTWQAKLRALELLWPQHRGDALARFQAEQGAPLEQFATFCVLAEQHGRPWQEWPEPLRRPDTPAVADVTQQQRERVDFWCWVQLLVDEQLAGLGDTLPVGVVHDLAVGVDAGGADAWALQDALAMTTTVGAPPDSFNQQGQDWGLPPWRPDRLRELGYLPFRDVVRGCLRHAGGLRIDHVMGLFRLWWVPSGAGPANGTYVSYDSDAMLGILALEATRAGAVVVGEDLGTVEDRVRRDLDATGVFGSAVLWFERDEDTGEFLRPDEWRANTLASVTTHDLPTAAGFLAEEHVRVRDELGQLGTPVEQERARVREEREQLVEMLRETGLLDACDGDLVLAMHAALVAAPSRLVLAAFGDAVRDLRQPNLPGTVDEYPNWRLPVADAGQRPMTLEEILASDGVARLTELLSQGVRGKREEVR